jgi:predicted DNA-binding transcriptional regulator YafY
MEILSFGNTVKVIQPQALIDQIKLTHEKAFSQYK